MEVEELTCAAEAFMEKLMGRGNFERWCQIKRERGVTSNSEFISWLLDSVEDSSSEHIPDEHCQNFPQKKLAASVVKEENALKSFHRETSEEQKENSAVRGDSLPYFGESEFHGQAYDDSTESIRHRSNSGHVAKNVSTSESQPSQIDSILDSLQGMQADCNKAEDMLNQIRQDSGRQFACAMPTLPPDAALNEVTPPGDRPESPTNNSKYPKKHPCELCGKFFYSPFQVRRHMSVHTGNKPFKCPHCDKGFTQKSGLKGHLVSAHIGVKAFACSFCEARFARMDNLMEHERKHNGQRPYTCTKCCKTFTFSSNYNSHAKNCKGAEPTQQLPPEQMQHEQHNQQQLPQEQALDQQQQSLQAIGGTVGT